MNVLVNLPNLREKMNARGLSNVRLANESNVSESTIKRILSGSPTTFVTAEMLASTLGTTLDELSGNEPELTLDDPAMNPADPRQGHDEPEIDPAVDRQISTKEAIVVIEQVYLARIDDWRQRVEDQKAALARSRRECHALLIFIAVIVAFVCTMLAVDILNPTVGWIRG